MCWRDIQNKDLSDSEVIQLLKDNNLLNSFSFCIKCEDKSIKTSRPNMIRCNSCNVEWSIRKGSILEKSKVPLKKLLVLYFLFLDGISSHKASLITEIDKNTSNKFFKEFKKLQK